MNKVRMPAFEIRFKRRHWGGRVNETAKLRQCSLWVSQVNLGYGGDASESKVDTQIAQLCRREGDWTYWGALGNLWGKLFAYTETPSRTVLSTGSRSDLVLLQGGNGGVIPVSAGTWSCPLSNLANQKLVTPAPTPQAQPVSTTIEFW